MNSYRSLQKQNNSSAFAVVTLVLCVVLSATVLFSRLMGFAPMDTRHYIPLTKSGGITTVREGQRQSDGSITFRHVGYHPDNHRLLTANPGFRVYDDNTVWESQTDIEIFKISYENGEITVRSENGDKVLAPGTENTYRFALENTGNVDLEYSLEMEAWFGDKEDTDPYIIPVLARVTDYRGNYLAGTSENMPDVLELNGVTHKGSLTKGYIAPYTLEWQWPFEGDDVYDTMLGNLAVEEEITLTIKINVLSSYTPDAGDDDGIPKTGDSGAVLLAFAAMVVSGVCLLVLMLLPWQKRRDNDEI